MFKGFCDYFGVDVIECKQMLDCIVEIYYCYGFDLFEISVVEMVEVFGKFLFDVDCFNVGVFVWQEVEVLGGGVGDWLVLCYDLIVFLVWVVVQFCNDLFSFYCCYVMGLVWCNEKFGLGWFCQFY